MKAVATLLTSFLFAVSIANAGPAEPIKVSKNDMGLEVFDGLEIQKDDYGADMSYITSFTSTDKKFITGLYKSGPVVETHIEQDYGDDEFMYILSGSITLKSVSGNETVAEAGDVINMPKEWRGTWISDGYTKLWVIYNPAYADEE